MWIQFHTNQSNLLIVIAPINWDNMLFLKDVATKINARWHSIGSLKYVDKWLYGVWIDQRQHKNRIIKWRCSSSDLSNSWPFQKQMYHTKNDTEWSHGMASYHQLAGLIFWMCNYAFTEILQHFHHSCSIDTFTFLITSYTCQELSTDHQYTMYSYYENKRTHHRI